MSIEERIKIDHDEYYELFESKLALLQQFQYDDKYRSLLGKNIIDKMSTWSRTIQKQKNIPLTIVVCGEFKRGKSSLINALLGEDVVTTNITTETITVNRISYGEHCNELVLQGGRRLVLSDEELKCDNLKGIIKQVSEKDKITMLELKRPLDCLKDICIIDTPGLGDSLKDFTLEVDYALTQADAVIYVFSANYPLSMQEQFFIKTAIKPQKYTDLFLVANYCDMLETKENCIRVREAVSERIKDILPGEKIHMLSALMERRRQLGKGELEEELDFLNENFQVFRKRIEELINLKRDIIIPNRFERMLGAMLADLDKDIQLVNDGLAISLDELKQKKIEINKEKQEQNQRQDEIKKSIERKAEIYRSKAIDWMNTFIDCMEADIDTLSDAEMNDIRKYYSVFCVDALQTALNECNNYFVEELYAELEEVSLDIAKKMSMNSAKQTTSFKFNLSNFNWTKGDKLTAVAEIGTGLGILPSWGTLMPFVGGFMREGEIKNSKPEFIQKIREQYPQLRMSIIPAISKNYKELSDAAKMQIAEYYADQSLNAEKDIEYTEMISRQDSERKQQMKAALEEVIAVLNKIREELTF